MSLDLGYSDIVCMATLLFPERTRCASCRKKLDRVVLDGQYCSYKCAGAPEPAKDLDQVPRHCKRQVGAQWGLKTKYRYEGEVPQKLRDDPATNVYRCDYCHFLHVGHSRLQAGTPEKLRRLVSDPQTLGSVILRVRESKGIDKRVLAKALKVPAIRITEIERGDAKVDSSVLFQVLYALRISVELIEK